MPATLLRQFVQVLLMGEALSLRATLGEHAVIHDPTLGRVETSDLARLGAVWRNRGAARDPHWVAMTVTPERVVAEFEILVSGPEGSATLPVAAVADCGEGPLLTEVRLYHSFWPLEGAHHLRGPIRPCDPVTVPDGVVARYQDALAKGDVETILSCFSEDAYAREPAGGRWVYRGPEGLSRFYTAILAVGGIPLRHCSVTDDGARCALEYVTDRWGAEPIAAQSGVAVYERAGALLAAARIYDDIDPPL